MKYFLLASMLSFAVQAQEMIREKTPSYALNYEALNSGNIQHFYEMLDPQMRPISFDDDFHQSEGKALSSHLISAIDSQNLGKDKPSQGLFTLFTRVTFIVDRDVSTFTNEDACDLSRVSQIAKVGAKRVKVIPTDDECSFHLNGHLFIPTQDFTIESYQNAPGSQNAPDYLRPLSIEDGPQVTRIQNSTNFKKVFFYRTAKATTTVTNVYGLSNGRSLVDYFTYHLLFGLPPKIGGGPEWVREQMEKQYPKLQKAIENQPSPL